MERPTSARLRALIMNDAMVAEETSANRSPSSGILEIDKNSHMIKKSFVFC